MTVENLNNNQEMDMM